MLKQKMYYKDSILFLSDLKYLGLIQTISFLQIEFSLAPFFFSIKTLITMYKQTIYTWQKLIRIIWLKCHKR